MLSMLAPAPRTAPSLRPALHYQPLVVVLTAAVAGILLDRFWPMPLGAWSIASVGGLGLWLGLFWWQRNMPANFALLLAVAATAGAWHHCQWYLFASDDLGCYAGRKTQPVCVEVLALSAPRMIPLQPPNPLQIMPPGERWRFDVDLIALRNGATWQPVSGRAALQVNGRPPKVEAGDRLRCFGQLSAPAGPQNPGARNRSAYLRSDRVRCQLQAEVAECLSTIEPGQLWAPSRLLARLRAHGNRVLEQYLAPQQAELAAAVLLGLREELDGSRNEAFLTTGTIHILSISGLHVGILAWALLWIMRRTPLPRGLAVATVALVTLLYAMMVDVEPPVVRATVLVLVMCVAIYLGRDVLSMNALAAAALVVLAMNPSHLFHVGAQLSFLCVAILIWFAPQRPHDDDELERRKRTLDRLVMQNMGWFPWMRLKLKRSVVGFMIASSVIWLLTLPLVMARFHVFSPIAIFLNLPLWPLMTLSLLSGFGVLVFGTIFPPLGYVFAWLCDTSFWALEWCVNMADRCPWSHFWLPGPPDWWLWAFYGALGLWLAFPHRRPSRRWCMALLVVWVAVGFAAVRWPHDRTRLDCTFLSMGHGSAVLLELPSGQTMLYDAGQFGSPAAGVRTISEFLWSRGITHLDTVVLSHPDIDHYNALPGLLEKFSVGEVCVSPVMFERDKKMVHVLRNAIDAHGVPVCEVQAGDRIASGDGWAVDVLHPPRRGVVGHDNASSLVLAINYLGRQILLPGDLESPGLDRLLAEERRPCEVLMAPHHGSKKSNLPSLAAWCTPRHVVLSGDSRWSLPEIEAPYRAVGGQVWHTFDGGAIQVKIDAKGVEVVPFIERGRQNLGSKK